MGGDDDPRDREAFERAVSGARPVDADAVEPPLRRRRFRPADAGEPAGPTLRTEHAGEGVLGAAPGVSRALLGRLGRGEIEPEARLELHGLREEVARERTLAFLEAQATAGLRCVRIVHGRGARSPDGRSVLREALPAWLEHAAARGRVLAHASAPPRLGGSGATLVLLRRPQRG